MAIFPADNSNSKPRGPVAAKVFTHNPAAERRRLAIDPTALLFYIAVFLLAFYLAGNVVNSRRVSGSCARLAEALRRQGATVSYRRAGPSAGLLSGKNILEVISDFSIAVILLPLTNPITWLAARAAGRRDVAVLRGRLVSTPRIEATMIRKGSPAYRYRSRQVRWVEADDFIITIRKAADPFDYKGFVEPLKDTANIWMLVLSTTLPHIQVYMDAHATVSGYMGMLQSIRASLSMIRGD
jgi:hypothetical protein